MVVEQSQVGEQLIREVETLQVACILFVGSKLLLSCQDSGLDFDQEYEMAKAMANPNPDS